MKKVLALTLALALVLTAPVAHAMPLEDYVDASLIGLTIKKGSSLK